MAAPPSFLPKVRTLRAGLVDIVGAEHESLDWGQPAKGAEPRRRLTISESLRSVTHPDLATVVASRSGVEKARVQKAIKAMVAAMTETLKAGEDVRIVGFGTIKPVEVRAKGGSGYHKSTTVKGVGGRRSKPEVRAEFNQDSRLSIEG